ncbi:scavenger receptor cysteine-rich type 1 protein M130-like, partial [Sphaeramia orbicularis]|uniref:scavenger receptor cysteine-rich type 1 protein M130-like n=1 Tax=Sphaeramia orbicularis TaxID=375764 RepID=UPI0011800AA0
MALYINKYQWLVLQVVRAGHPTREYSSQCLHARFSGPYKVERKMAQRRQLRPGVLRHPCCECVHSSYSPEEDSLSGQRVSVPCAHLENSKILEKPIKQHAYRVNPTKRALINTEVKYLLDHGFTVPTSSPWSSPSLLVPKPDQTPRFCNDYRKVNAITKPDSFPLPRIDDCVDRVGSAMYVTKLDLLKGYRQEAFESVKALLCSAPVLAAPDFSWPFKLEVDASAFGAGAVLLQEDEHTDDVRLVGGASRCNGKVQIKHNGEWRDVGYRSYYDLWTLKAAADSVRLVHGYSLCSGRLEVRSNQSWSSVCEEDLDLNDTQVVCRELGCGAPGLLQGALYGEGEAPVWTSELQCEGNESAVLDCRRSSSAGKTCSPGSAAGLTCSDPGGVRLVGQPSRCAGTLEIQHQGHWRPVEDQYKDWDLESGSAVCQHLDCGSAVSVNTTDDSTDRTVWGVSVRCVKLTTGLRDCVKLFDPVYEKSAVDVVCSDLLPQPNISLSDGVFEVY